jgi:hypothetical protein
MPVTTDAPLLVVFPRGQLSDADKAQMRDAGIIAVEADDPKAVQQMHLTTPLVNTAINGDAIVRAALHSLAEFPSNDRSEMARAAQRFVTHLAASLGSTA